jgi:hypothetical protein
LIIDSLIIFMNPPHGAKSFEISRSNRVKARILLRMNIRRALTHNGAPHISED